MKISKNDLIWVLLAVYAVFFAVFLGKIALEVSEKPVSFGPSSVPSLSVSQLEKISTKLEAREKLNYIGEIDLSKIQFGRIEPFNP